MYSDSIKRYLKTTPVNNKISRSGKFTKSFQDFNLFCESTGLSLKDNGLLDYSLSQIKICILNDLLPPKCHCGKSTAYSLIKGKWVSARCSISCRSTSIDYISALSKSKKAVYQDSIRKREIENKKSNTLMKNYGVAHPMQNIELFLKQQKACFKKDNMGLHGYEPLVYPQLIEMYPDLVLGTSYLKNRQLVIEWIGDDHKKHRSYPDFFSESLNAFIEIKSTYTRERHNNKLMKCRDRLNEMHFGYFIVTYNMKKSLTIENFNVEYTTNE